MRVLIIGATGQVGGYVLSELLALPNPPTIRVSSRSPHKTTFPSSVEVVQADLADPSSYARLFVDIDRCFVYVQPATPVTELCTAAKSAGVNHVVFLSSFTVQYLPDTLTAFIHSRAEEAVLAVGLPYTFLRAAYFAKNTMAWLSDIKETSQVRLPYPNAYCAPVTADDIAAVAVVALTTDRLLNASPIITGPESLSLKQMVSKISALRLREGKSAVEVLPISVDEWRNISNLPPALQNSYISYWELRDGVDEDVHSVKQWTGRTGKSFDQYLEENKAMYLE